MTMCRDPSSESNEDEPATAADPKSEPRFREKYGLAPLVAADASFPEDDPVTVMIAQRVKRGREAEFEQWIREITEVALTFDGHLGTGVLPPTGPGEPYRVVFRFKTRAQLRAWEESPERADWLARAAPLRAAQAHISATRGLAFWVPPPDQRGRPRNLKVMTATLMGLVPTVFLVNWATGPLLGGLPGAPRLTLRLVGSVIVMQFVAMPLVNRLLRGWLYPR